MIGPDLVRVRRKNGVLSLAKPSAEATARARELSEQVLAVLAAQVGEPRQVVEEALNELEGSAQEKKLLSALKKLALDDSAFDGNPAVDAISLRRELFSRAAAARRALAVGVHFDRSAVLSEAGAALGLSAEAVESGLYSDLRSAERLLRAPGYGPDGLLARHARAEVQAVLLCSVRVVADVRCASADQYRALFHKLKFRQLMFQLSARDDGGYRIEIDGPYSLFDSVTKYGMELALLLPALEACDSVKLVADLRWGKKRDPLSFSLQLEPSNGTEPSPPRDDIQALIQAFSESNAAWRAEPAREVLELPGIGLCVPDLCFTHQETGEQVLCEVLGFWNRAAVWRRVELVEQGLPNKIVFVASARLRVSEDVLEADSAALYVYKGAINAKALQRKLDALIA